ncbi:hypothetical protein ACH5RR_009655 [Cinchona calisaya]|uniref:Methenyltetrahydrofolate cyclohydrolase n=1 Tax=Cinchona calisaya TaxID=153742 RepID=A0ABD3AGS4_9GENT
MHCCNMDEYLKLHSELLWDWQVISLCHGRRASFSTDFPVSINIASEIHEMKNVIGRTPGLGVVRVGQRRDSHIFISTKVKACNEVGIVSVVAELPEDRKEDEVRDAVSRFNENPLINGIIVQLPLPKHLEPELSASANTATVSVIHAFTKNPEQITSEADIVVSDVGVSNMVRGHWMQPGAVVIDMGTNSVKDAQSSRGYRLVGDVCYEEAITKVSAITLFLVVSDLLPLPCSFPILWTLRNRLYNLT